MKNLFHLLLPLLMLACAMASYGQDASTEPRAVKGGHVQLALKNVPADDVATVSSTYIVNRGDGTIKLPYLKSSVRVEGMTARDAENIIRSRYIAEEIYSDPIVQITYGNNEPSVETRLIQVSGFVAKKSNLPYREGITLIEALLEAGDITDYGSRKIQVTRGGVTRTYDYFSARDRSIKLLPKDSINVPRRPAFESRPASVGP